MTKLKGNIKKLSAVFLAMVVIATSIVITGCGKTVINLRFSDLYNVRFYGYDGNAAAEITVNEKSIRNFKRKFESKSNYSDIERVLDSMTFEMEKPELNGNLHKNETFIIVAKYDEDFAEQAGIVVENTTFECSGRILGTASESYMVDPFEGFKLEYHGENGNAYATSNSDNCAEKVHENNVRFEIQGENKNLKNGDKIIVYAKLDDYLAYCECFLTEKSKVFTVEGLTEATEATAEN